MVESRSWTSERSSTSRRETGLRPEEYPHITFGSASRRTVRCFPDKLPIGIEKEDTSRFVFLYLVNRRIPVDFRQFLIRHRDLFANLHRWTLRLLVPRRFRKAVALYKAAVREELWTPLNPSVSKALETYFRERQEQGGHLGDPSDRYIAQGVPEAGHAEDPGPLSGVATNRRQGALAVVLDVLARRLVVRPFGR